jgi:hypothetical protein
METVMSFIKTYLITAAIGLAVAGGVSVLSLHAGMNRGNGDHVVTPSAATDPIEGRSQPRHPALYGSNLFMSAEPAAHAD